MNSPQSIPQSNGKPLEALEDVMADLKRDLGRALDRDAAAAPPHARPPTAPPVSRQAPAPADEWGPSTPRFTSPLALLVQVADNAHSLAAEMAELIGDVTGEEAAIPRQRSAPKRRMGLLPNVAHYATDIAEAHAEIARQMIYIRERLM